MYLLSKFMLVRLLHIQEVLIDRRFSFSAFSQKRT